jgi:hypothetical protein
MKIKSFFVISLSFLLFSCEKKSQPNPVAQQQVTDFAEDLNERENQELKKNDVPILPVSVGDQWIYEVKIQVPENAQIEGAKAINQSFVRKRTFIGKTKPTGNHPETDCFEIESVGSPIEREYVAIDEENVKMCGSEVVGGNHTFPIWLNPPVTLVRAGVKPGESLPPIQIKDAKSGLEFLRVIQIVARENLTMAGRDFETIRILMTGKDGKDGNMEIRRTIWFAPHFGIVKEEKLRYINDKLILKELTDLKSMRMKIGGTAGVNP